MSAPRQTLTFFLHDELEGRPLTPETVDLLTLQTSWVHAEKYLTGRVVDIGGKTRPNVHLVLASGESVEVDATEAQLEGADYLYRAMTLNVSVKEHIRTGEIRQARLIGVVKPLREVDEDKLKTLWQKGKKAWEGISSPTEWVDQLRQSWCKSKLNAQTSDKM